MLLRWTFCAVSARTFLAPAVAHSIPSCAPGKDILWYTREKGTDEEEKARQELLAVKQREEDLMAEVSWVQS